MPAKKGLSPERLKRIDAMLQEFVAEGEIPGVVALIAPNEKIVFYNAFGHADKKLGRVLNRDDVFRIASQTKTITATAVMLH